MGRPKDDFRQGGVSGRMTSAREDDAKADFHATLGAADSHRRIEFGNDRAGIDGIDQKDEGAIAVGDFDGFDTGIFLGWLTQDSARIIAQKTKLGRAGVEGLDMLRGGR